MTFTFVKRAVQHMFFGFLSVFLKWAILSGVISVGLVVVGVIATITATSSVDVDTLISIQPIDVLSEFPQYKYINYVELLWAGLIFPITIGGGLFTVVLAQGRGDENIVDFYKDVAGSTVIIVGILILVWLMSGLLYLLVYQAPLLNSNPYWSDFMEQGLEGLKMTKMDVVNTLVHTIMNYLYPYFPIPVLLYAYYHIIVNVHAGWSGNIYTEEVVE